MMHRNALVSCNIITPLKGMRDRVSNISNHPQTRVNNTGHKTDKTTRQYKTKEQDKTRTDQRLDNLTSAATLDKRGHTAEDAPESP